MSLTPTLFEFMKALCRKYEEVPWTAYWEHYLWDALLSDGTIYRGARETPSPKLDTQEYLQLRKLFQEAKSWPVWTAWMPTDLGEVDIGLLPRDARAMYSEVLHCETVVWGLRHQHWLRIKEARDNLNWRLDLYKTSGRPLEEIAEERDRLLDLVLERNPHLSKNFSDLIIFDRLHRHSSVYVFLPPEVRAVVQFRFPSYCVRCDGPCKKEART